MEYVKPLVMLIVGGGVVRGSLLLSASQGQQAASGPVLALLYPVTLAIALIFALGFFLTNNGIDLQATIQIELNDTYRARVMSMWVVLVIGGAAISAITLGAIADLVGMSTTLVGAGILGTFLVVLARMVIAKADGASAS